MTQVTRTLLEQLPKAELHCHLDGSVRPATLLELGREYGVGMPRDDAEALGDYMVVRNAHSLEEYLTRFDVTLSVMQHADAIERIAQELAMDAAREGVLYLETRFAPCLNDRRGLEWGAIVEAAVRGLERAERERGIVARVIVCGLRHLDPATSLALAKLAVEYKDRGVVAFDLAGAEAGHPASAHADAFRYARSHGLHCTCHAGEGAGAESVAEAVRVCQVHRVGHATHLIDDAALTDEVKADGITLELCLTSNVQTHATESYEAHPLRRYLAQGVKVVLNTDNRLMSGVSLVDEYDVAARTFGLSFEELSKIALNGFDAAFLPDADRSRLRAAAVSRLEALRR